MSINNNNNISVPTFNGGKLLENRYHSSVDIFTSDYHIFIKVWYLKLQY